MIDTTKYTQLLIFKRHWTLSVAVGLAVLAVILPVAMGLPPVYRSTANLRVERQVGTGTLAAATGGLDVRMQTIKEDLLSRTQVIKLIEDLDLYTTWRADQPLDVIVERVRRDILVQPQLVQVSGGTQAMLSFQVSYTGEDPETSKRAAQALANFYVAQNGALRTKSMSRAVQDFKTQYDDADRRWRDASANLTTYVAKNSSHLPSALNAVNGELQRLNTQITSKTGVRAAQSTRVSDLKLQIATATAGPTTAAGPTTLEQQRDDFVRQLKLLTDKGATDAVPGVRQLKSQIASVEEQIRQRPPQPVTPTNTATPLGVLQANLRDAEADLARTDSDLEDLNKAQSRLNEQALNIPTSNPEYEGLNSEVRAALDSRELNRKLYEQAVSAERSQQGDNADEFRVEDPARLPDRPYGPNRLNLIIAGLFMAVVAGIGAAILRDQLDTSFHTIDELRAFTQVPILVSIPDIKTGHQRVRQSLVATTTAIVVLGVLGLIGVGAYHYAQRHVSITRIVSK